MKALATVIVLVHLAIAILHGNAHSRLGVDLSTWQSSYVMIVIIVMPLAATVLLWTRYSRVGFILLAVSMAGSLIFGGYFHYVEVSSDHVSHLPAGDSQGMFRLTAMLLAATEAIGLAVAMFGLRHVRTHEVSR